MKRLILLPVLCFSVSVSWADMIHYMNSGPAVTLGPVSHSRVASAGRFNPAAVSLNTDLTRLTLLDFTANLQLKGLGEFNTVFDNMSDQIDTISNTFDDFGNGVGGVGVGDVLASINDLEAAFDTNIELLADNFYIKPGVIVSLPLTPWNINAGRYGALSLSASSLTQTRASILHGDINFDIDAQAIIDTNDNDEELDPLDYLRTTSSLYLKQAQVFNADLSWSHALPEFSPLSRNGIEATGGLRATLIAYNLQKNLYPIKSVAEQAIDGAGDLAEDIVNDVMNGFSNYSYAVSLDVGVTLQREDTLVGITLYNLNNPELNYNVLGGNCASITDSVEQSNCFHAEYFASVGDISLTESHRLSPRMTIDVTQSFLDNSVSIAGSVDLWRKNDLFGEQSQNLNLGVMVQPTAWYWPRLRLGVGKDLVDMAPTQLGLGLSLFNFLQIDTQATTVLGDLFSDDLTDKANALRSVSASASINLAF